MSCSVHRHYDAPGRMASSVCISGCVTKQCPAICISLLCLKPQYSQVTHQSLQQKEVNLPLFSHCTNKFDRGLFGFFSSSDFKKKYEYIYKHSCKPLFFVRHKKGVDIHNLMYLCPFGSSFLQQCT